MISIRSDPDKNKGAPFGAASTRLTANYRLPRLNRRRLRNEAHTSAAQDYRKGHPASAQNRAKTRKRMRPENGPLCVFEDWATATKAERAVETALRWKSVPRTLRVRYDIVKTEQSPPSLRRSNVHFRPKVHAP